MGPLKELHMEFPINPKKKGSIWGGQQRHREGDDGAQCKFSRPIDVHRAC